MPITDCIKLSTTQKFDIRIFSGFTSFEKSKHRKKNTTETVPELGARSSGLPGILDMFIGSATHLGVSKNRGTPNG